MYIYIYTPQPVVLTAPWWHLAYYPAQPPLPCDIYTTQHLRTTNEQSIDNPLWTVLLKINFTESLLGRILSAQHYSSFKFECIRIVLTFYMLVSKAIIYHNYLCDRIEEIARPIRMCCVCSRVAERKRLLQHEKICMQKISDILFYICHKSHNASVPYFTMHHFVTEMCAFLLQSSALWDTGLVHYGIYTTGLLIRNQESTTDCVSNIFA